MDCAESPSSNGRVCGSKYPNRDNRMTHFLSPENFAYRADALKYGALPAEALRRADSRQSTIHLSNAFATEPAICNQASQVYNVLAMNCHRLVHSCFLCRFRLLQALSNFGFVFVTRLLRLVKVHSCNSIIYLLQAIKKRKV